MSHFDDVEPIFWGEGPKSTVGAALFLVVAVVAIVWAVSADNDSKALCEKYGEKYIDSKTAYTLCEFKDGTVVRRYAGEGAQK